MNIKANKLIIVQVSYGRTVNIGSYESIRFDLTARVEPGDSWRAVYRKLQLEALALEKLAKKGGM